ncbi:hypothetical protein R3I94_001646 [Phoxinus phoxinus]
MESVQTKHLDSITT